MPDREQLPDLGKITFDVALHRDRALAVDAMDA